LAVAAALPFAPMSLLSLRPVRGLSVASMALVALLSGCQSWRNSPDFLGVITPYRLEIVQGNVITKEQAAFIKPGMTRAQVRDVLGSPLLTDPFHADRWDYVFTIRRQGAEPQLRRVVALFKGDALASIDTGGNLPGEREFVASIDTFKAGTPPPLALSEAELKALPTPPRPPAAEPVPPAPLRTYPPLEPSS
jgi:outer membrane protein assembly factor BamE